MCCDVFLNKNELIIIRVAQETSILCLEAITILIFVFLILLVGRCLVIQHATINDPNHTTFNNNVRTYQDGSPLDVPHDSIRSSTSIPSTTIPNATWCPFSHGVATYV